MFQNFRKWNHMVRILFCLVTVTQHGGSEIHPRGVYQ